MLMTTMVSALAVADGTTRTMLMADDASMLYSAGTQRRLQPLERSEMQALIQPDKPWEKLLAYNTVLKFDGTYRMWYQSCDDSPSCVVCYATSTDGLHWTKPLLSQFSFGNITETNIVMQASPAEGPRAGLYYGDVLYDPLEVNASRRFKMVLFDLPLVPGVPHGSGRPPARGYPECGRWAVSIPRPHGHLSCP